MKPLKIKAAIGLIQSSSAMNSLSGIASTRIFTFWPICSLPRSTSSSFSSMRISDRSGISAMAAPVQARSPSLNGGGDWPNEPPERKFGRILTMPSLRGAHHHLGQIALARSTSRTVLSFFCSRRSRSASCEILRDVDTGLHLLQFAFGDADIDPALGAFDLRNDLGFAGFQLGALQVVFGLSSGSCRPSRW